MQESISLALSLSFSFALSSSLALARLLVFNSNGSSRIALQTIYICDLVNVSDFGVPMSIISTCKLEFSMYRLVLVVLFSPLAEFSFASIFRHNFGWFFVILLCAVICPKKHTIPSNQYDEFINCVPRCRFFVNAYKPIRFCVCVVSSSEYLINIAMPILQFESLYVFANSRFLLFTRRSSQYHLDRKKKTPQQQPQQRQCSNEI